jgi:hypothetical protein
MGVIGALPAVLVETDEEIAAVAAEDGLDGHGFNFLVSRAHGING